MVKAIVFIGVVVLLAGVSFYVMQGGKSVNKKILFVLMPKGYQDIEFNTPYKMLADRGCTIDVAGLSVGTAQGSLGGNFTPNKLLTSMTDEDLATYDALVIPGGPGSVEYLWAESKLNATIKFFYNSKKVIASICHATGAVAKSGVLKGKKATGFPSADLKNVFKQEGVEFIDKGCFTDKADKMITAQSPKFAKEFGQELVKMLE